MSFLGGIGENFGGSGSGGAGGGFGVGINNIPALAKLMIAGHSYASESSNMVGTNGAGGASTPLAAWPEILRDVCAVPEDIYIVPIQGTIGAATAWSQFIVVPRGISEVHSWEYICNAAIPAGSAVNFRTWALQSAGGLVTYATYDNQPFVINTTHFGGLVSGQAFGGGENLFCSVSRGFPAGVAGAGFNGNTPPGAEGRGLYGLYIYVNSTTTGSGAADPGGFMIIKLLGRYWNVAIGGSALVNSDNATVPNQGGWSTWAKYQPKLYSQGTGGSQNAFLPAGQMRFVSQVPGTSITVDQLPFALSAGAALAFSNGATAVVTGSVAASTTATAIPCTGGITGTTPSAGELCLTTNNPIDVVGHFPLIRSNSAEGGLQILMWGINDVGSMGSGSELFAWKESIRWAIALAQVAYKQYGWTSSGQYSGISPAVNQAMDPTLNPTNGTGGTWTHFAPGLAVGSRPQYLRYSGSATPTGAFLDIWLPSWFDGSAVDLFFWGSNNNGTGGGNAQLLYGNLETTPTLSVLSQAGVLVNGGNSVGTDDIIDTGSSQTLTIAAGSNGQPITAANFGMALSGAPPAGAPLKGVWWVQLQPSVANVTVTNGSPNITVPSGGFPGIVPGMLVSAASGIPAGTYVKSVSGNTLTMTQNANASPAAETVTFTMWVSFTYNGISGSTLQNCNFVDTTLLTGSPLTLLTGQITSNSPTQQFNGSGGTASPMVKRITGLPAGGGRIRLAIGQLAAAASEFILDLWGIEASGLTQPTVVASIPYISNYGQYTTQPTPARIDKYNNATLAVIAERSTTDIPARVVYANLNAYMNVTGTTPDPTFQWEDGIHPSDKGHAAIATSLIQAMILNFTNEQLCGRS